MASETYDYEPFGNTEHSMKQIADAIRHKGYGKDVREAIAEGIGQFDQVKGEVFRRVKAVEDDNAALNQRVDKLAGDLSAEAQKRVEADKELDGKINALRTRLSTAEGNINDLQKRAASLEEQVAKLNRIIFGMEYIDDTDEFMLDNSTPNPSKVEINDDVAVDDDNAEVVKELPHEVISNEVS